VSDYVLVERTPTVIEYRELRRLVGLSPKTEEAAATGLPNTRFAVVLDDHQEALVTFWTERVAATMRGRLSHAELQRQNAELRRAFHQALAGSAQDLSGEAAAELRAQLAELSATRARQGFSTTETAVSIFSFKDAVLAALDAHPRAGCRRLPQVTLADAAE
jgi:hypothetical protein